MASFLAKFYKPIYFQISDVYGGPTWSVKIYCALTLVVLVPLTQITKLKYLVPFSAIANFVWLGSICISIYYCLRDPPKASERNLATSITGVPTFIRSVWFANFSNAYACVLSETQRQFQQFLISS